MELLKEYETTTITQFYRIVDKIKLKIVKENDHIIHKEICCNGVYYIYVDDCFFTRCKHCTYTELIQDIKTYQLDYDMDTEFKIDNLIYFNSYSNMIFDVNGEIISCIQFYDETNLLSSPCLKCCNFDTLIETFRMSEYVENISVIALPYYNAEYDGQKGFTLTTYVPSYICNSVWLSLEKYGNQRQFLYSEVMKGMCPPKLKDMKEYDIFAVNDIVSKVQKQTL